MYSFFITYYIGEQMYSNITTIISDFDGTILRNGAMRVEPEFIDLLEKLLDKGYRFIAASGRQHANLQFLMGRLADRVSYACENGAIAIAEGNLLQEALLSKELVQEVITEMQKYDCNHIVPCTPDLDYVLETDLEMKRYLSEDMKSNIQLISDFSKIDRDVIKVSVRWDAGIPYELEKQFQEKFAGRLMVMDSGNNWIDFVHCDANKANALRKIGENLGFTMDQVLGFGDGENDIQMLQTCGMNYLMDTAREPVKAALPNAIECKDVKEILRELL